MPRRRRELHRFYDESNQHLVPEVWNIFIYQVYAVRIVSWDRQLVRCGRAPRLPIDMIDSTISYRRVSASVSPGVPPASQVYLSLLTVRFESSR